MRPRRLTRLAAWILSAAASLPACGVTGRVPGVEALEVAPLAVDGPRDGPRVLAVVAHPDDEIAFGGLMYRTATALRGTCDVFTITDGAGGYRYSTLAEPYYGVALTDPQVAARELPAIRKAELAAGCRFLGVRKIFWVGQPDRGYTLDPADVLERTETGWDVPTVLDALGAVLREGRYDFVLTHTPVAETHGHHQAATRLALRAVAGLLDGGAAPVVLGVRSVGEDGAPPEPFGGAGDDPATRQRDERYVFDRGRKLGFNDRLDLSIVVNQAIAAHVSQGTMQLLVGPAREEHYFPYAITPDAALPRVSEFFAALAGPAGGPTPGDAAP